MNDISSPPDSTRSERARLSLTGLSVGDALGQQFFLPWVAETTTRDTLPEPIWHMTDDTEMAISIVKVLEAHADIDQDALAQAFSDRHAADPNRIYGAGTHELLNQIAGGANWRVAGRQLFGGEGSFGNGGAMRVGPLGAWFADDVEATIEQARKSSEVTHAHIEGQVGAIAVALAAGWAWRWSQAGQTEPSEKLLAWVADRLPESAVAATVRRAAEIPPDTWAFDVAAELGCGDAVTALDTVAFSLWMSAVHLSDYPDAILATARVGGDVDTTCAIVGSIVALAAGPNGIPEEWIRRREPLSW
jgi:ADP-ribosylglycohydrolase